MSDFSKYIVNENAIKGNILQKSIIFAPSVLLSEKCLLHPKGNFGDLVDIQLIWSSYLHGFGDSAEEVVFEADILKFYSGHDSASFLNNGSQTHYFIKIIIFSMVSGKFFDFCQNVHFDVLSQNPEYEP